VGANINLVVLGVRHHFLPLSPLWGVGVLDLILLDLQIIIELLWGGLGRGLIKGPPGAPASGSWIRRSDKTVVGRSGWG